MDKEKIYRKLAEVISRKDKHIQAYKENIDRIAASGADFTFFQGYCEECNGYEREIKELENLLKNELNVAP